LWNPYVYPGFPEPTVDIGQIWDTTSSNDIDWEDEEDDDVEYWDEEENEDQDFEL
jgi:hypothetical protein